MRNCKVKIISLNNLLEKILIINAVSIKGVLHKYYKDRPTPTGLKYRSHLGAQLLRAASLNSHPRRERNG